mgnify:CR=1 FL=1
MNIETEILRVLKDAGKFKGRRYIAAKLGKPFSFSPTDPIYLGLVRLMERNKVEYIVDQGYAVVSDDVKTISNGNRKK